MTLTLSQATPAELAQAGAELDAIRASPAFHLCAIWLRHRDLSPAPVDYPFPRWIAVGWLCNVMRLTFGGSVAELTMALALEARGVALRLHRDGSVEACLDERVPLEAMREHRATRRAPRPWPEFSDHAPVSAEVH